MEYTERISELEKDNDIEGLKDLRNEAEAGFDGDAVGQIQEALRRISQAAHEAATPTQSEVERIKEKGGTTEEIASRTSGVRTEAQEVSAGAQTELTNLDQALKIPEAPFENKQELYAFLTDALDTATELGRSEYASTVLGYTEAEFDRTKASGLTDKNLTFKQFQDEGIEKFKVRLQQGDTLRDNMYMIGHYLVNDSVVEKFRDFKKIVDGSLDRK